MTTPPSTDLNEVTEMASAAEGLDNDSIVNQSPAIYTNGNFVVSTSKVTEPNTSADASNVLDGKLAVPTIESDTIHQNPFDEKRNDNGDRKQNVMINIPEHENDSVERTILHIQPLTEYVATSNYMNNTNLDLQNRFSNALNTLDMFSSVDFPPCSLQGVIDLPIASNTSLIEPSPPIQEPTRVSAYAKLIFEDGYFYMNTYSVVLGRDLQAWHAAIRKEKRKQRQLRDSGTHTRDHETPARVKNDRRRHSRSIVSESGGILRAGNDTDTEERVRCRRLRKMNKSSKNSKSTGSSSLSSRRNSTVQSSKLKVYEAQNLKSTISPADGPVPVDPATFRPSPHDCPLVAIHPPATAPISAYKSISREHVKISFNSRKSNFEAHIIGRNGCFVQDQWYHTSDVVPLKSGDFLQVGGITVQFMLPNQLDPTTVEYLEHSDDDLIPSEHQDGGIEENVSSPDDQRGLNRSETSEDDSASAENDRKTCDECSDEMSHGDETDMKDTKSEIKKSKIRRKCCVKNNGRDEGGLDDAESKASLSLKFDKRRGPGRPPKNGILSKREQKLLKKEEKAIFEAMVKEGMVKQSEKDMSVKGKGQGSKSKISTKSKEIFDDSSLEKAVESSTENFNNQQFSNIPAKNKVGRPRKHPLPDNPDELPREKRKYTKRKPKEPKNDDAIGSGAGDDCKTKKEKVPPRPPRSPSPVMNEEDFTPEQLAKPQANYVTLIHEALSNAPTQQLGLPDIYRAIYRKYPYFKFKTQTLGWQSSVRHNLSQHHAFRKVEKDGKGWTWGIVDGISIEKEKKRRATPPPQSYLGPVNLHQNFYPSCASKTIGNYPYGPPTGYQNMPPSQFSHYQLPQPNDQASAATGFPPSFLPTLPLHLALPNVSKSYNSPYAPKPIKTDGNDTQPIIQSHLTVEQADKLSRSISDMENSKTTHGEESRVQLDENPKCHIAEKQQELNQNHQGETISENLPLNQEKASLELKSVDGLSALNATNPSSNQECNSLTSKLDQIPSSCTPIYAQQNEDVIRAAEAFKKNLLDSLKSKQSEIIVSSAINRVLGITSANNDSSMNPQEEMIMTALRSLLSKIPGSNIEAESTKSTLTQSANNQSSDSSISTSLSVLPNLASCKAVGSGDGPISTVLRPNFTVNRPPLTTAGSKPADSKNSINTLPQPKSVASAASPVLTSSSVNENSSVKPFPREKDQVAGKKRVAHDDADEIRDFKRLTSSGPLRLKI